MKGVCWHCGDHAEVAAVLVVSIMYFMSGRADMGGLILQGHSG